jgi:predicted secreted protein
MEQKPVSTKIGDTFEIRLKAPATSGYRWKVVTPSMSTDITKLLREGWEQKSSLIGAPSDQIFIFQAIHTGRVKLDFGLTRGREKDKILKHYVCEVEIKN